MLTTQTKPAATALHLTQDELYWAQFAEAAGWRISTNGLWLRPAHAGEVPDIEISAATAYAACQFDGLGPERDKPAHDTAAQLTVEGLADAMRANRHNATKEVLAALGYSVAFQEANRDAAVKLANASSVTHLADLTRYLTAVGPRRVRVTQAAAPGRERMDPVHPLEAAYDEIRQAR